MAFSAVVLAIFAFAALCCPPCNCQASCLRGFQCASGDECKPSSWRCDGERDCQDGSDEQSCVSVPQPVSCPSGEYKCGVGGSQTCVVKTKWCDGTNDCGNNADESFCFHSHLICEPRNNFKCPNERNCISQASLCNGVDDCSDAADEDQRTCDRLVGPRTVPPRIVTNKQETSPPTSSDMTGLGCLRGFQCASGDECKPSGWRCDGVSDCRDGSDELGCSSSSAPVFSATDEYKCGVGSSKACVPKAKWCDGNNDCGNQADEDFCFHFHLLCEPDNNFKCPSGRNCVSQANLCDGVDNCNDAADEDQRTCARLRMNTPTTLTNRSTPHHNPPARSFNGNSISEASGSGTRTHSSGGAAAAGSETKKKSSSSDSTLAIAAGVACGVLCLVGLIAVVVWYRKRNRMRTCAMATKLSYNVTDEILENGASGTV